MIRTLLVEDEPLARASLKELVQGDSRLQLVGEAATGPDAVAAIDKHRPDLVFLDVELPGFSGIEVLQRSVVIPSVIFTTAAYEHAVLAFELDAADYLLKPFGRKRFTAAIDRFIRIRARQEAVAPSSHVQSRHDSLTRIVARKGRAVVPVRIDEIVRFEADDDYSIIFLRDGTRHLITASLGAIERRLNGDLFLRVHRSHVINLDQVRELRTLDSHRVLVRLSDGSEVAASRAGSARLRSAVRVFK